MDNAKPQTETKVPSAATGIREAVKAGLVHVNEAVKTAIVASFVQEETNRRIKATTAVLEKIEAAEVELRKIKPTFSGYTIAGEPVGEPIFAKEQVEAHKKAKELLDKLNNALEKALNSNDFSKVFELAGK